MWNIPTSYRLWYIIHINYSLFFIRFGESRTDKRNSTRQLIKEENGGQKRDEMRYESAFQA